MKCARRCVVLLIDKQCERDGRGITRERERDGGSQQGVVGCRWADSRVK